MKIVHFTARLISDAVISERAATTGGHRSLDYLPGAALLGAVADRLYTGDFPAAFTIFHTGKVRFSNAYPLSEQGEPGLPIPLCWHLAKGEETVGVSKINNLIHADDAQFDEWDRQGIQQKQLRSGYFSPSGEKIEPARTYRLKTAISREKQGMADDAQLFGYQSLSAGSNWYFTVSFDEDIPQTVMDEVIGAFSGMIRVGRSRSAEYGMLAVSRAEITVPQTVIAGSERLLLYCASDLALVDPVSASPLLIPTAEVFGLSAATFNAQKSYLRIRSYAPFNAKRRHFDLERQVLAKGSVLVFDKTGGFSADELNVLQQRLGRGIGLYRQDGLGQIIVNPTFLENFGFNAFAAPVYHITQDDKAPVTPPVAKWLLEKEQEKQDEIKTIAEVDGWINELVSGPCPKNSQWGQLRTIAVQEADIEKIREKLKKLCSEGVSQKQWHKSVRLSGTKTTYSEFILGKVLDAPLDLVRKRLYLLGNRLPRKNNQRNGGDQ